MRSFFPGHNKHLSDDSYSFNFVFFSSKFCVHNRYLQIFRYYEELPNQESYPEYILVPENINDIITVKIIDSLKFSKNKDINVVIKFTQLLSFHPVEQLYIFLSFSVPKVRSVTILQTRNKIETFHIPCPSSVAPSVLVPACGSSSPPSKIE